MCEWMWVSERVSEWVSVSERMSECSPWRQAEELFQDLWRWHTMKCSNMSDTNHTHTHFISISENCVTPMFFSSERGTSETTSEADWRKYLLLPLSPSLLSPSHHTTITITTITIPLSYIHHHPTITTITIPLSLYTITIPLSLLSPSHYHYIPSPSHYHYYHHHHTIPSPSHYHYYHHPTDHYLVFITIGIGYQVCLSVCLCVDMFVLLCSGWDWSLEPRPRLFSASRFL